jgi:hypothetical protein
VLFIDDDETEVRTGSEDGAAGADDDARPAITDLVPFIVAFTLAEMGVQHGDFVLRGGEARLESLDGLRREGNLGHEHDGGLAALEGRAGWPEGKFPSCRYR